MARWRLAARYVIGTKLISPITGVIRPHLTKLIQGLLVNKDTHRPWGGPMPLGLALH